MRVLHLHRIRRISGSERHLLTLLPALRERGLDVRFLGLDDPAGQPERFYDELRAAGVPFERVPAPRDVSPLLAFRVAAAVRRARPDVVHTHLVHADVYGAMGAAAAGATLVSTKHNDDPFRTGLFRIVERVVARRAARVIAITAALARFNEERVGLPGEKLVVVPYGLDNAPVHGADGVGLPAGARLVLSVGRLVPQKAPAVAVRALAEIRRERDDVVLAILGTGPQRTELERLAAELGVADALHLPGNVETVGDWLRRADVFLHTARWEGFGLVLLEAMLASVPVVATRVSSVPEIVADGETGLLVQPDDPGAVAAALSRLLADEELRSRLAAAGAERARTEFSVARMADATARVYEDALARRPATSTIRSAQDATE